MAASSREDWLMLQSRPWSLFSVASVAGEDRDWRIASHKWPEAVKFWRAMDNWTQTNINYILRIGS